MEDTVYDFCEGDEQLLADELMAFCAHFHNCDGCPFESSRAIPQECLAQLLCAPKSILELAEYDARENLTTAERYYLRRIEQRKEGERQ